MQRWSTMNEEIERVRNWEAESHGFRVAGSPSLCDSNISMWVALSKNICRISEYPSRFAIPVSRCDYSLTAQKMINSFHWTEIGAKYYILLSSWHVQYCGRSKILWASPKKFCNFWQVNIHKYYQLNTFALFPDAKTWRRQRHDEPLPRISVDALFRDHDGHVYLWAVTIYCDHFKWPILKLSETFHDWLIMMTIFLVKAFSQTNAVNLSVHFFVKDFLNFSLSSLSLVKTAEHRPVAQPSQA